MDAIEVSLESFLKERIACCKKKIAADTDFLNPAYTSTLVLALATFQRLDQMLFVIRMNNELSLKKEVGTITIDFGSMMQNIILDMIESHCEDKQSIEQIHLEVLNLTGIGIPDSDSDRRSLVI